MDASSPLPSLEKCLMMRFWQSLVRRVFVGHSQVSARANRRAAGKPRFRPMLESLEDRTVPATLTVTNLLDSGAGSLRGQIAAAASGDTVNFASGLSGTITLSSGELAIARNLTISGP